MSPTLVFAAYDDVTLTTDTVLSVNGITLNVSGTNAAIQSITVNDTDFSVSLPTSANFKVSAPNLNSLTVSTLTGVTSQICNGSQSVVGYETTTSVNVTITPSTTLCTSSSGSGGGSSSSSSSSSGGSTVTTPVVTTPVVTTPAVTTPVVTTPSTTTSASGLSVAQIKSILDVLASFDADASVIAKVKESLEGTVKAGLVTSVAVSVFKTSLTIGSLGSEVKMLQQFLNAHGYKVAASGLGSPGNETTRFGAATKAALIKYQKAKGITPAAGYFGEKTRAAVNAEK